MAKKKKSENVAREKYDSKQPDPKDLRVVGVQENSAVGKAARDIRKSNEKKQKQIDDVMKDL